MTPPQAQTRSCRLSLPSPGLLCLIFQCHLPLWKPSWLSRYVSAPSLLEHRTANPPTALLNRTCCSPMISLLVRLLPRDGKLRNHASGMPWQLNGKESICQCWSLGFDPWSGKTPHATEQLSPCPTTTGPVGRNYRSLRALEPVPATMQTSHCKEKLAYCM